MPRKKKVSEEKAKLKNINMIETVGRKSCKSWNTSLKESKEEKRRRQKIKKIAKHVETKQRKSLRI